MLSSIFFSAFLYEQDIHSQKQGRKKMKCNLQSVVSFTAIGIVITLFFMVKMKGSIFLPRNKHKNNISSFKWLNILLVHKRPATAVTWTASNTRVERKYASVEINYKKYPIITGSVQINQLNNSKWTV